MELREGAVEVVRRLRAAGYEALWAGGCVRDEVMGIAPKDYDVATNATPEQVMEVFDRSVPVGVQFGVVMVLLGGHEYEVATFRAERGYTDGRRPDSVEWAGAREDVLRRDFTINGLLYDPIDDETRDFVGGMADIKAGVVRAIGDPDARFGEDKLRLLRAIRFAARLGFSMEDATWEAVKRHAADIDVVSVERVSAELGRMLGDGEADVGLRLLVESNLMPHVLPELADPALSARAIARLHNTCPQARVRGWALLLYDLEPVHASVTAVGRRLRLSSATQRACAHAIEIAHALAGYKALGVAQRKRLVRREHADLGIEVATLAAHAGHAPAGPLVAAKRELHGWDDAALNPGRLLSGHDLSEAGFVPGPAFKTALDAVEDAQLEGRVSTLDEAWEVARGVLASNPSRG